MSPSATFLCYAVVLAVFVAVELAPGVCCFTVTRSTTPSARRHDTVINIAATQHDRTHRRDENFTVEVGPLVWNHERGTWLHVTETSTTTPDIGDSKHNATSIIIAPDLVCDEGEVKDMNGVCREDWGRMMAPVSATEASGKCSQGQVADERGQCRGGRGGGVASPREPVASGRGASGGERRSCPTGQAIDQQGQCRPERGRRNRSVHT